MSIQSEIERINGNVANTYDVLSGMGADIPEEQNTDNLPDTAQTVKAVLYKEQTLDDTQKEQARANIGAAKVSYDETTKTLNICSGGVTLDIELKTIIADYIKNNVDAETIGAAPNTREVYITGIDEDGVSHYWRLYGSEEHANEPV